jgi:energy-coupling factor transport system substrate-specific component
MSVLTHRAQRETSGVDGPVMARSRSVLHAGLRQSVLLALATVAGLVMFCWPLFARVSPSSDGHVSDAPLLFVLVLPVLVAIVLAAFSEGGMDSKALAMLGVLSAVNAALRPLGAGIAGVEVVFFMLVLAGRVFGPAFGFVLGCTSLFASALLTAGVGPWLPFQMMSSAWIGMGAGLLPRRIHGRAEVVMLVVYGIVAAYFFGFLMDLWFWPFAVGGGTDISFVSGASLITNLQHFTAYAMTTSFGWDTGRAVTNSLAILAFGPAVLATLRRAVRRASFGAPVTFDPRLSRESPAPPSAAPTEGPPRV